jgi:hypothetical protein
MPFHIHLSALDALKTFVYVLIAGTLWRLATLAFSKRGNHAVAGAMAIAY